MTISDRPHVLLAAANQQILATRACPSCGEHATETAGTRIRHKPSCIYSRAAQMRRLPLPRLQLRWFPSDNPAADCATECVCEMVLPAAANDVRDVDGHGFVAVSLGNRRGSREESLMGGSNDNCHMPTYVIAIDGSASPLSSI